MQWTTLIIEDVPEMANFMRDVLAEEGRQVYVSNYGTKGLQLASSLEPDLVLLDLQLPDVDGSSLCRQLKNDLPDTTVILVTGRDTPESMARGLNLGADDYVTKPVTPELLLARVRSRLRTTPQHEKIAANGIELDRRTHEVTFEGTPVALSAQEYRLLEYFLENPNKVLTRSMILSRIWKSSPDIQTRVVDVYVGYLRKKLSANNPKMFQSIRGFGYMLVTAKK